ncbi:hypothetical protein D3C76_1781260 [compost metagenome]
MQNAFADAVEIPPRAAEPFQLRRKAILYIFILAPAALQDQPDVDRVLLPLFKMNDRRTRPQVVSTVLSR